MRQFGAKREARGAVRRLVDLECGVFSEVWGEVLPHRVTDISEDGLWIETDLLLDVGSEVTLTFHPPDWNEPLCVAGRVCRVELEGGAPGAVGMGIGFDALRNDERRQLTHSMRCLRAEASYLLDQRTLVGVPVGPSDPEATFAPSANVDATVVGWSVPSPEAPLSRRVRKDAATEERARDEPGVADADRATAFGGGLELAASLFGDDE